MADGTTSDEMLYFDPARLRWTNVSAAAFAPGCTEPAPRAFHGAALLGKELLVIMGLTVEPGLTGWQLSEGAQRHIIQNLMQIERLIAICKAEESSIMMCSIPYPVCPNE